MAETRTSPLAFVWVYAALIIVAVIPFLYVVPNLMRETEP
jgi:TRAP-type C4-dicarboxylate transport system permease small subunit